MRRIVVKFIYLVDKKQNNNKSINEKQKWICNENSNVWYDECAKRKVDKYFYWKRSRKQKQ